MGRAGKWTALAMSLLAGGLWSSAAQAQIMAGDDIPWESAFTALVSAIPADPATFDINSNGLPDAWEYTLAEEILTNAAAPAHRQRLLDIYNANYDALVAEAPGFAASAHYLTLAVSRGDLLAVATEYTINLNANNYQVIREILDDGDPDGDFVLNVNESGTDAATYASAATTSRRTFKLGAEVDLLDASFYNGGQRMAFWGQLNNAGTTVAFHGVELAGFVTEIYLVDLGDPSSWRKLTTGLGTIPQSGVSWSPDDSRLFIGNRRIDVATGAVSTPSYLGQTLVDSVITSMASNNYLLTIGRPEVNIQTEIDFLRVFDGSLLGVEGLGGVAAYEWNSDGDEEGWTPIQSVNSMAAGGGTLNITAAGSDPFIHGPAVNFDAAANPYVAIRMQQSFSSRVRFFWTTDLSPSWAEDKVISFFPERAGAFETIILDMSGVPNWAGNITQLRLDPNTLTEPNIRAIPVHRDGSLDLNRDAVYLTNFDKSSLQGSFDWVAVAPDFNALAVADYRGSDTAGVGDPSNIVVVRDLPNILAAAPIPGTSVSSLAPRGPEDNRAAPLRESGNFGQAPSFSQDASLVMFVEDTNDLFRNADFFGSLSVTDLDVGVSSAKGNSRAFILNEAGNQSIPTATRGGTRVLYVRDINNPFDLHLFMTTLETETRLAGAIDGNGQLQTTVQEVAVDPAGTVITMPPATTITFPVGVVEPGITIETPSSPVEAVQLPPVVEGQAVVNAIPVVRTFGPSGTTFAPAIPVTISYTDQEIEGLIESELRIFLFNSGTGLFDIEVPDAADEPTAPRRIISRDLANNTITFLTTSFSSFGIGSSLDPLFDGDGDGIPDVWELDNGLDPNDPSDAALDDDSDGLTNLEEFQTGTLPNDPDSDGDGMPDGWEVQYGLNPNDPSDAALDDDSDGLTNLEEFQSGTEPDNSDTDGDGLPDGWEVENGLDPLDDGSIDVDNGPNGDPDNDGFSNGEEFAGGSDPNDPLSDPTPLPLYGAGALALLLALCGAAGLRRRGQVSISDKV